MYIRIFSLLILLSLAGFSDSSTSVTNIVRLPVFCDVSGKYTGTYTDGTWNAVIDAYTGIANVSVKGPNNVAFNTASVRRMKDSVVFSLDLPDGTAWRGKFTLSKTDIPTVSGNLVNFDSNGKFEALRNSPLTASCESLSKSSSNGKE